MADAPLKKKVSRKSAFSCEPCRKRKVKCNGASPSCSRCSARGETCVYSLAPTLSYTKQLEARVEQLENTLWKLQRQRPLADEDQQGISPASSRDASLSPGPGSGLRHDETDSDDAAQECNNFRASHDGRLLFHRTTSIFQQRPGANSRSDRTSPLFSAESLKQEPFSNGGTSDHSCILPTPEHFQYLLDLYWCWTQPVFNFVDRQVFIRESGTSNSSAAQRLRRVISGDMQFDGPYYSETLLHAIFAHSLHVCREEIGTSPEVDHFNAGTEFHRRAVSGLHNLVSAGHVDVPLIQTLLILSTLECVKGNQAQAWLYSGMALRMLDELGITNSYGGSESEQLNDEEVDIRRRIYWSCYTWDKLVSLLMGRSPTLQHTPTNPPRMKFDEVSEVECWTPHGLSLPRGLMHPPSLANTRSSFVAMCGLAEIISQTLTHAYDFSLKNSSIVADSRAGEQEKQLQAWWEELPISLKLDVTSLPSYCPPGHILLLNCLYRTVVILLHRPFLYPPDLNHMDEGSDITHHLHQCLSSASAITNMFGLYHRTYGDSYISLPLAYTIWTAASVFLQVTETLQYLSPETLEQLKFCISVLERTRISVPVMIKPLTHIYQELERLRINIYEPVMNPTQPSHVQPQPGHLVRALSDIPLVNHGARSGYVSADDQEASGSQNDAWSPFAGTSIATTPLEYPLHQALPNFGMHPNYLALLPAGYALGDTSPQQTLMTGGSGSGSGQLDVSSSGVLGGGQSFAGPFRGRMPPVTDCGWIPLN